MNRSRDLPSDTPTDNLLEYGLGGVSCSLCDNKGYTLEDKDGLLVARECRCMKQRRSIRAIKNSGMADMLARYAFGTYETPDNERKQLKKTALDYIENGKGWLVISGKSGSGKTHLCTAICTGLIDKHHEVKYMLWRDEAVKMKAMVNEPQYNDRIKKLIEVDVLYIDDFFKGTITPADINLAFQIINGRYLDITRRTIISTELSIEQILAADEAVGGRIYERSKNYCLKAPNQNWRLK